MNSRVFAIALIVTLGVGLATLSACPPYVRHVVVKKVVVERVVEVVPIVSTVVAYPLIVPAYSAGFVPGYNPGLVQGQPQQGPVQVQAQPGGDLAVIVAELRRLNARLDALEGRKPATQADPSAVVPAKRDGTAPVAAPMLLAKCASCHDAKVAAKEGNGLSLFQDGHALAWTERQKSRAQSAVFAGRMPKGSKLSDEDAGAAMAEIDAMK